MATYAIGDIHGDLAALRNLLELVLLELHNTDTLVFLGDYIDRGPDSKGCVEEIIQLKQDAPFSVVTSTTMKFSRLRRTTFACSLTPRLRAARGRGPWTRPLDSPDNSSRRTERLVQSSRMRCHMPNGTFSPS